MAFRREIHSEITIDATPDEVWDAITDFARYPEWNPGFSEISGRAEVGTKLDVTFAKEGGKGLTMHPTVLVADPGREFRWIGSLLVPWVFDGEHRFEIHEEALGRVRFVQAERFRGVLVPFLHKLIDVETVAMFHRVNDALAARVTEVRSLA
jgi:hypothetical protein